MLDVQIGCPADLSNLEHFVQGFESDTGTRNLKKPQKRLY